MKRFKNVLVIYVEAIGGDNTLGQAVALVRTNSARLTIAGILRENQTDTLIADEIKKRLNRLVESVGNNGITNVDGVVITGIPFLEITRRVIRAQHDLVIISAEAGKVLKDVFFGSTAAHLIRKCPCPVRVAKPNQPVPYARILAAVDPCPGTPENDLNVRIMDMATALASRDHAVSHILYAWDVAGKDFDTVRSKLSPSQRKAMLEKHERRHRSDLNDLLFRYTLSDIEHHIHMPRDNPARAINTLAKREQIDLITMGTAVRIGIPGFFIANAAETVLGSVRCGMLTIKPDRFETPITIPAQCDDHRTDMEASALSTRRIA